MKLLAITTLAAAGALFLGLPNTAHAGLDACGNIDVSASAQCELVTSGGCVAMCEPLAFEAACAGQLYAGSPESAAVALRSARGRRGRMGEGYA